DANGDPTQHLQYLPFGENYIEQRVTTDYYTPYTFSAKERDMETGYSYFGARYYDPNVSVWLSVDPMADGYPEITPYLYCHLNPMVFIDPNGMAPKQGGDEPVRVKTFRELVVERAFQHLNKKTTYESAKSGAPGSTADCSGFVSDCLRYAGYPDHRNNPGVPKSGGGYYSNGVAIIVGASLPIAYNQIEPGDLLTFKTSRTDHKGKDGEFDHIGIVVNVIKNENGEVSSVDFIHVCRSGMYLMNWDFAKKRSNWSTSELDLKGAFRCEPPIAILPTFTVSATADPATKVEPIKVESIPATILQ
ncbi:MAG TPA: RHS repeat-associated core domain-containing protein, partial [Bacteroidales bacterium]|nr:RHS repeat-associated core domain-containing protein [Bacteroidales bacterium]